MIDHDRLFKELISTFFWEFIELFLPEMLGYVERDEPIFLREEIFTDVTSREKKKIDLLVQVRFRDREGIFLVHVESQAAVQADFNRRMFIYFARLHAKYNLPIFPIAIFSFDGPYRPEPDCYHLDFPGRQILRFNFATIQLNRLNWRAFLRQPNPVAAALMAKMQIEPEDRPKVKLECLRMLVTLQLDPARTQLISGFVDSYLKLNDNEEQIFQRDLENLGLTEEERVMEIITSWMEKGIERGIERGVQEGVLNVTFRLLRRRFGELSSELETRIQGVSVEQAENLCEAIFDFQSDRDLLRWLQENTTKEGESEGIDNG